MHNKKYALKLVQDKLNGLNNYSYSKIAILSGYKKLQIVRFAPEFDTLWLKMFVQVL